jgi:hypothetical protein
MKRVLLALAGFLWVPFALAGPGVQPSCVAGNLTCTADSGNARNLITVVNDPVVQTRVYNLWMGYCQSVVYAEIGTGQGHANRTQFCGSIAAQKVPLTMLVSAVLSASSVVVPQILCTQGTTNDGCMVDADVLTAIDKAMTVTASGGLATRAWP